MKQENYRAVSFLGGEGRRINAEKEYHEAK
jgi:hypothetical protein